MTQPVPHALATADLTMADGAVIRLRRHGNPDGPRIVMSHGNGLAMNAYRVFWQPLCDDYDIVLFDFRNHGANPPHKPEAAESAENHNYATFAADMEAVYEGIADNFGAKPAAAAFHSLSAVTCALHGLTYGPRWEAVAMFDPPFSPPTGDERRAPYEKLTHAISARARRRPRRYASVEEFAGQLRAHRAYGHWADSAHADFAAATLRPDPGGDGFVLACPRELEGSVFLQTVELGLWERMGDFPSPLCFICGDPDALSSQDETRFSGMLARETGIELHVVPGTDHFLQIENPAEAARLMTDFLGRHGFGV